MSDHANMNGNLLKTTAAALASAFSRLYSPAMSQRLSRLRNVVYSGWIRRTFRQADRVSFSTGLRVIGGQNISIGTGTGLGRDGVLQAWSRRGDERFTPSITIGSNCWIGDCFNISAIDSISIGNDVLTGRYVTILDNSHGDLSLQSLMLPPLHRKTLSKGAVRIGDKVWIGDKVTILAGVTIGDSAVIAANSVVTHDVAPYSCVGGCPAKELKANTALNKS